MPRALGAASFLIAVALGFWLWRMLALPIAEGAAAERPAAATPVAVAQSDSSEPPLRVLFVGNSHTYRNDLPKLVQQLAAAHGARPLAWEMIATGGARLSDHVAQGKVAAKLVSGSFHALVLQEQQQLPSWGREQRQREMIEPARMLSLSAQANGAKTFLTMTWARRDGDPGNVPNDTFAAMHERSVLGHVEAAQQIGATLVPASIAWHSALKSRPDLALWQSDGSHPALAGSYLAACLLYRALYGRSPTGNAFLATLPERDAAFLQELATTTRPPM